MSEGVCTYCSGPKRVDPGLLPAVERYRSERIVELARWSQARGIPMWIVSGRYGLITPSTGIPFYDHLLQPEEVGDLVATCASTLRAAGIHRLAYHTAHRDKAPEVVPYRRLVEASCGVAGVELNIVTLPGVPV